MYPQLMFLEKIRKISTKIRLNFFKFLQLKKVQVGKDQEKAQSAKDSHSKSPSWEKKQTNNQVPIP